MGFYEASKKNGMASSEGYATQEHSIQEWWVS